MARDKDRYSRDQRFEVILDNGEDQTKWSDLLGNVSNVASGTEHVTAGQSVSFDKVAGVSADAYIVRPVARMSGVDLDAFSSEGQILSSVYFSSIADVASFNVALLMSSGTENGAYYTVADTDLSAGWNHIKIDCATYATASGSGVDWRKVKYIGVGASFDDADNTLAGILVDSVRVQMPTAIVNFDPNIGNITVAAGTEIAIKDGDASDELSVDAANTARTSATNVIPVQPIDASGNIISGGGGTSGGLTLYSSPVHFSAVYQAATALDLSGMSFTITNFSQFVDIEAWDAAGGFIAKYTPKTHDFSWDAVNDRVTVTGAAFVTSGTYKVSVLAEDRTISLPTDAQKTIVLNPLSEVYAGEVLADVTNGADDTYYYYVDMSGYGKAGFHFVLNGGSGTVTVTVEGTLQDDGTAAGDITNYEDITTATFGVPSTTSSDVWVDDVGKLGPYKYVRVKVIAATGAADDADWTIYSKRLY